MTDQQRLLRKGLAASHRDLYLNSAWFRSAVDQFALMLPYFVDGLALEVPTKDAEMQRSLEQLSGIGPLAALSWLEGDRG